MATSHRVSGREKKTRKKEAKGSEFKSLFQILLISFKQSKRQVLPISLLLFLFIKMIIYIYISWSKELQLRWMHGFDFF